MRTIYFTVLDTLSDWEAGHVLAELHSGRYLKDPSFRYEVILCGQSLDPITTMGGLQLEPEVLVEEIRPGRKDLLLLPGADTWLEPRQAPVIAKVRNVLESGATVGAICGATLGLANAGLLDNRPHTSNAPEVLKMFCQNYHGERFYVNEPAVTDGNLITASGLAPVEFAYHIFRQLDVMTPATLDAWYRLYTTRKPDYYYQLVASRNLP
ncbi:MAG TPA: type 1 glutamine amidotransferase family protein [Methanoregula sp.]|nr:type 1 glutamine amidotransferase family protein [Methanoregula sp.]